MKILKAIKREWRDFVTARWKIKFLKNDIKYISIGWRTSSKHCGWCQNRILQIVTEGIMRKVNCRKSYNQQYECCASSKVPWKKELVSFDVCLGKELFYLWDLGIRTVGSCCGKHVDNKHSYIQVEEKFIDKMKELGYKEDTSYEGRPHNCFLPKTI